jgi:hypothetical protein
MDSQVHFTCRIIVAAAQRESKAAWAVVQAVDKTALAAPQVQAFL